MLKQEGERKNFFKAFNISHIPSDFWKATLTLEIFILCNPIVWMHNFAIIIND